MGRHVATGRKRGIAGWPLLVLGVIVLLVGGTLAYFAVLRNDDRVDPAACTGSVTLPILASSGASPAARALSDAFNSSAPAARSTCLTTSVISMESSAAAEALIGHWKGRTEPAPGVWLTDNGSDLLNVDAQASDVTAGRDADPLATSPVVLAVRKDDATATAGASWPKLASEFGTSGSIRGADGRPLPLLLSDPRTSRATSYAAESMLASGSTGVTVTQVEAATDALTALRSAGTDQPTTGDALDLLASGSRAGAVPVTEADLAVFNAGNDAALTAVYPSGPAAGDEVFGVALSGDWMTPVLRDAATRFTAFTRSPGGAGVLAAAHFRVPGAAVSSGAGVDAGASITSLPPAAAGVSDAIAAALGFPGSMPTIDSTGGSTADPATSGSGSSADGSADPSSSAGGSSSDPGSTSAPTTPSTRAQGALTPPTTSTGPTGTAAPSGGVTSVSAGTSTASSTPTASTSAAPSSTVPAKPGPNVTFLVDTSASWAAVIDGKSRIQWLQQGLTAAMNKAGNVGIGLWATSSSVGDEGFAQLVTTGPLTAKVDGGQRTSVLQQAIGRITASGSKRFYSTTPTVMTEVAQLATAATPGRVVLVTDGADQTPATPRSKVTAAIRAVVDVNPSLRLDVIGVGDAAPADALGALAAAGRGSYSHVDTKDLPTALAAALTGR